MDYGPLAQSVTTRKREPPRRLRIRLWHPISPFFSDFEPASDGYDRSAARLRRLSAAINAMLFIAEVVIKTKAGSKFDAGSGPKALKSARVAVGRNIRSATGVTARAQDPKKT